MAISAGAAFGNSSCADAEYECGSETLTSAVYEAVRKGSETRRTRTKGVRLVKGMKKMEFLDDLPYERGWFTPLPPVVEPPRQARQQRRRLPSAASAKIPGLRKRPTGRAKRPTGPQAW